MPASIWAWVALGYAITNNSATNVAGRVDILVQFQANSAVVPVLVVIMWNLNVAMNMSVSNIADSAALANQQPGKVACQDCSLFQ